MKLTPLNRPLDLFGTGFPNGKVVAPVGSIYTDTDATNGAIRWIKTRGTGNTGWEVEYGDTGWRNIVSLLPGSTGVMLIRRSGDVVEYAVNALDNSEGTQTSFNLPQGYNVGKTTHTLFGDVSPSVWVLSSSGSVSFGTRRISGSKHVLWLTEDPWPISLPGTPA